MKMLLVFADGFEDVEAITTRDVLIRAGIEVDDVTINRNGEVIASHKIHLKGLKRLSTTNLGDYSGIILPGGVRGVNNLINNDEVIKAVRVFAIADRLVCAICAAPMVLSDAGVLDKKRYTCYPGCEEGLRGNYTGEEVVVDGNLITARSMMYSIPFGLAIVEKLLGKEKRDQIYNQIAGIK